MLTDKQCYVKYVTYYQSYDKLKPRDGCKKLCHRIGFVSVLTHGPQLDIGTIWLRTWITLLKSENRFHAQHLLPRAVENITDEHVATIYEADIYLSLEDFRWEVARWRTHWVSFKHLSTLNDLSAVALATGMVNKTQSFINTAHFASRPKKKSQTPSPSQELWHAHN
jgi:hypothetical protein